MTAESSSSSAQSWLRPHPKGCTLSVRIQPGARRNAILGIHGEGANTALKIAIQAPPIEGRANEALITWLAARLGLARSQIELLTGATARSKILLLCGTHVEEVQKLLAV
jgi:hypothetical protein